MSYPDNNGNDVDIYLYVDGDERHIPAPKFYWKVLKDETKDQAVAFIGLNDPHADDVHPDEAFCTSICSQIIGYVLEELIFWLFIFQNKGFDNYLIYILMKL